MPLIPGLGTCFPRSCTTADAEQLLRNMVKLARAELPISFTFLPCVEDEKPPLDAATIAMMFVNEIGSLLSVNTEESN